MVVIFIYLVIARNNANLCHNHKMVFVSVTMLNSSAYELWRWTKLLSTFLKEMPM